MKRRLPMTLLFLALCLLFACTGRVDRPGADTTGTAGAGNLHGESRADADGTQASGTQTSGTQTSGTQEPEREPPDASDMDDGVPYRNLIFLSAYATGARFGTPLWNGYAEIYNTGDTAIPLKGLALYVGNGDGAYTEFRFDWDDVVPPQGSFLLRGADPAPQLRTDEAVPLFSLSFSDAAADIVFDDRLLRLVIAPAGAFPDAEGALAGQAGVMTYLSTHPLDAADRYHYVADLSRNKLLRKGARTDAVGYETYHLERTGTAVLRQILPANAAGERGTLLRSARDEVLFSLAGGFYGEAQTLTMTAPAGYTVYYTLDGRDPRTAENPLTYEEPVLLRSTAARTWGLTTVGIGSYLGTNYLPSVLTQAGGTTVKAYAVCDGESTPLTTATYFIGTDLTESGVQIVNVSLDPDALAGEEGIYNPAVTDADGAHRKAGAYVEWFSPDGTCVFASQTEIALNGKGSLGMMQKSFRILFKENAAGAEGGNLSVLDYDVFGDYATPNAAGGKTAHFRRILLRNGGGDNSGCTISRSHIGDAYIARMDAGLHVDTMAYAPVLTFVNGEFFGIYNARERFDQKYFETVYGLPEEDLSMLECPYPLTYGWNADYRATFGDAAYAEEFMELVRFCQREDLTVSENYAYVAERFDLESLIDHYCAQIYLCCSDWPSNNIKLWRNTNPDSVSGLDTRWRLCIVDTDHGCGLNSTVETNLFGTINDAPVLSRMVNHLLTNPTFRDAFIRRFIYCTEVYYRPDRMRTALDDLLAPLAPLMPLQLERWRVTDGTLTDYATWEHYTGVIRDFVTRRPAYARAQLCERFGLDSAAYEAYKAEALALYGDSVPEHP